MPPACKAGQHVSVRTGANYKGIGPPGCKIRVGVGNQTLHDAPANTQNAGAAVTEIATAKQRPAQNNPGAPDNVKVYRTVRFEYAQAGGHVIRKDVQNCTLDTGAFGDIVIGWDHVRELFPGMSFQAARAAHRPFHVSGISGARMEAFQLNLLSLAYVYEGQKGHQNAVWRGGPAVVTVVWGSQSKLVGVGFMRRMHILVR